ncbi:uncharacterized mitochondrial protein AtMg00310-like [Vicia villosa]|uniref:uncharacterized mitochondrial protein AtMg00310-like n=1 Tax=Vicia villosa TaxID=3911 RepID=UPI00273CF0D0|nr:uncharacterized mitochondrial protein AtMg00310-like [Vicia villosa]
MDMTSNFLNCGVGVLPFKFLGIKVGGNPRKVSMWNEVIEYVRKRLKKWRGRFLSMGGRVTLLNSILNAVPIYSLSFYRAPKIVLNEIRRIQRKFLWGGVEGGRCINWVSWSKACKSKVDGGLGIRDVGCMNISLLMKWKWRILTKDSATWKELLKHRYNKMKVKMFANDKKIINKGDSIWWRDLILINDCDESNDCFVSDLIHSRLCNDVDASFWFTRWAVLQALSEAYSKLYENAKNLLMTVADVDRWEADK